MVVIYSHNSMYENYVFVAVEDGHPICSDAFNSKVSMDQEISRLVEEYEYKGKKVELIGEYSHNSQA